MTGRGVLPTPPISQMGKLRIREKKKFSEVTAGAQDTRFFARMKVPHWQEQGLRASQWGYHTCQTQGGGIGVCRWLEGTRFHVLKQKASGQNLCCHALLAPFWPKRLVRGSSPRKQKLPEGVAI